MRIAVTPEVERHCSAARNCRALFVAVIPAASNGEAGQAGIHVAIAKEKWIPAEKGRGKAAMVNIAMSHPLE